MNNEILTAFIYEHTNNSAVCSVDQYDMLNANIKADQLIDLVDGLKNKQGFIYLTDICAAHYPEKVGAEFEVIYHLHNLIENQRVRLKVALAGSDINIPTLTVHFVGANWMERETYDFYGIIFKGHPNLTRILNEDTMDYFPLRKEYHLEDATREDKDDRFFGR
jgi:NADH-quinone oxidoreductase subunit C